MSQYKFPSSPDLVVHIEQIDAKGDVSGGGQHMMDLCVEDNKEARVPMVKLDIENYPKKGMNSIIEIPYYALMHAMNTATLNRISNKDTA